jgi:hypothetical protein
MKPGFLEDFIDTRSSNGRDDTFLSELHFRDINGNMFKIPIGSTTDGGSTPRIVWVVPGFEPVGAHYFEYALHDAAYRGTLLIRHGIEYKPANLTRLQADRLLDRALELRGMSSWKRAAVYRTLRATGWKAFNNSRA